jgi:hypothetical protein
MPFDVVKALSDGHTEEEIAIELAGKYGYPISVAKADPKRAIKSLAHLSPIDTVKKPEISAETGEVTEIEEAKTPLADNNHNALSAILDSIEAPDPDEMGFIKFPMYKITGMLQQLKASGFPKLEKFISNIKSVEKPNQTLIRQIIMMDKSKAGQYVIDEILGDDTAEAMTNPFFGLKFIGAIFDKFNGEKMFETLIKANKGKVTNMMIFLAINELLNLAKPKFANQVLDQAKQMLDQAKNMPSTIAPQAKVESNPPITPPTGVPA